MITRRTALLSVCGFIGMQPRSLFAQSSASTEVTLVATWRGPMRDDPHCVGVMAYSVQHGMRILWSVQLPGRAHGLTALADGSFTVMAVRPGYWMQRYSAEGTLLANLQLNSESQRHFTGHALAAHDGQHIYTGETDPSDDSGWITVRHPSDLRPIAQWPTHGIEPHDLKLDSTGHLLVANGGIRRAARDAKRDLDTMQSSLVQLNALSGQLAGKWQLGDQRLSIRHLAWCTDSSGKPLLGLGLQAEHSELTAQRAAPVLAIWSGAELQIPSHAADGAGYAGDICSAPGGGFLISNHKINSALLWHPENPARFTVVAKLTEAYALSSVAANGQTDSALIAAARGAALWHPTRAASLQPWPQAMAMENHWLALVR
jgi:uncharacterized protein